MRPRLFAFMIAGLLLCAVIASPLTEVRAAGTQTDLVIDQLGEFQFHPVQAYDLGAPAVLSISVVLDVAYLPGIPALALGESDVTRDIESPVPRMEGAINSQKLSEEKVNRMKNSK